MYQDVCGIVSNTFYVRQISKESFGRRELENIDFTSIGGGSVETDNLANVEVCGF